jgi:hypothetical protein
MRRQVKVWGVLLMIVLVSSYAVALQKPVLQQAGTSTQLVISGQDVITASDAGGGALSARAFIVIFLVGVMALVLVAFL